jgi:hypothetical protein
MLVLNLSIPFYLHLFSGICIDRPNSKQWNGTFQVPRTTLRATQHSAAIRYHGINSPLILPALPPHLSNFF